MTDDDATTAEALTCPLCGFPSACESCPSCGSRFYRVVTLRDPEGRAVATAPLRPEVVAAARRIKRALHAEADRAAGIDTRLRRPLVDSLPALLASLASRHDLPMRVVADLLDEVVPMLDLLARVRELVDAAKDGSAMAWVDGFADIRDTLYPDTDVAKRHREQRATRAERAAAAEAAEREAWDGITVADPPELPTCPTCGMHMGEFNGPEGEHGFLCVKCDGIDARLAHD